MADMLIHLAIPFVALLAFYDRRYLKYVIFLIPLAMIPDIDHIPMLTPLRGLLLHNVFILIPTAALTAYTFVKRKFIYYNIFLIATFYLISHLLLDLHYVGLLYPFSNQVFSFKFDVNLQYGPAITSLGAYILLTFVLALIISLSNVRNILREFKVRS